MKIYDVLDTTAAGVVLGNHGVWLPDRGIKVPFQWGGRVAKFSRFGEATGDLTTISSEILIMRALAEKQMAPPVGGYVFFKNLISMYPGAWHCDPCGAYGYEIADATKLRSGKFDIDEMRKLPIEGSQGAWNDVLKPGNVVNGYLVDVRRSQQDLLRWRPPLNSGLPSSYYAHFEDDVDKLKARVHTLCQFPTGERDIAYQDFWLESKLVRGQRRVIERADQLGFAPRVGESVLDIGTQSGGFLQLAAQRAAGRLAGVDIDANYIDCARDLARSCEQNICFRQMDALGPGFLSWVRAYFPEGVDHLLMLSMEKHLDKDRLFWLIDAINAKTTYVETNAVIADDGVGLVPQAPMKLLEDVLIRRGQYVGDSRDRNLRRLYRIPRRA